MHIQALIMYKQGMNICFFEVDSTHSSPRNTSFLGEEHFLAHRPSDASSVSKQLLVEIRVVVELFRIKTR